MQGKEDKHIVFIDILKAMACICVLAGHVISGIIKADMQVSELLKHLCEYVYLFHVPCFFFASGYLYANEQIKSWKEYGFFVLKKLLILGTPYLSCTIGYVVMSSFISSEMNPNTAYALEALLDIWKTPVAQYWYLYALFELFVIIPAIERIFRRVSKIYLGIGLGVLGLFGQSNLLCVSYIIQYAHIFYLGILWSKSNCSRVKASFCRHGNYLRWGVCCAGGMVLYLVYAICAKESILSMGMESLLQKIVRLLLVIMMAEMSVAIGGTTACLKTFLLWVSRYSFYIYLFHTWFSGVIRILLRMAGVTNCWAQTFVGVVGGLIGPVLIAKIIRIIPALMFLIEPVKVMRKIKYKTVSNQCEK